MREALNLKADRVAGDRDLMWAILGIEVALGAFTAYFGLMLMLVIGKWGSGLACLVLGAVMLAAGLIPRLKPHWLRRWGVANPFPAHPSH